MTKWQKKNRDRILFYQRARRRALNHGDFSLVEAYRKIYADPEKEAQLKSPASVKRRQLRDKDRTRWRLYQKAYYLKQRYGDEELMKKYREQYAD